MDDPIEDTHSLQIYPRSPYFKKRPTTPDTPTTLKESQYLILLFDPFLRLGYYILLIPFRFGKRNNGQYYIHTNRLQQILSTITLTLVFFTGILDMRHKRERGLMPHPEKAFVWSYALILELGYGPVWFRTFWLWGRGEFEKLTIEYTHQDNSANKKYLWTPVLLLFYSEAKLLLEQVHGDLLPQGVSGMLQLYGGIGLYNLYLRDSDELSEEELYANWETVVFSAIYTILSNLLRQLEHLLEIMAVLGAVGVWQGVRDFVKGLPNSGGNGIVQKYFEFVTLINRINGITGWVVFVYMLGMVPTFVWCVFGIFELNSVAYLLYYVHKFGMHLGLLIIAAEAGREANKFKEWILQFVGRRHGRGNRDEEYYNDDDDEDPRFVTFLNFVHRDLCANPVGLKGGSFFTISYGFIGTTVSVIVTYAVIMLQFQVDRYKKGLALQQNTNESMYLENNNGTI